MLVRDYLPTASKRLITLAPTALVQEAAEAPQNPGEVPELDRQERAPDSMQSAVQQVRSAYQMPVVAVVSLADLMEHMAGSGRSADLDGMRAYRARYGPETEA